MLTRIDLHYFKCFEFLKLPLAPLTLLSGSNASGKSSVLQALVLLQQTMREHEWSKRLMLNGDSIRLGTVSDVVDKVHGRRSFQIGLSDDETVYQWTFSGDRTEMSLSVEWVRVNDKQRNNPATLRYLLPPDKSKAQNGFAERILGLTYITAERVGPREVYILEDRQTATVVGPTGEHALSLLHWGRDENVLEELAAIPGQPKYLEYY